MSETEKKSQMNPVLKEILSWVEVIVAAFVIAFLCNTFIIANSTVPTSSMESTILEGDRVIGSRLSYTFGEPSRGDISIFKFGWICNHCKVAMGEGTAPEVCPHCGKNIDHPKTLYYLKRCIGVPGDTVEIKADGAVAQSELDYNPGLDPSRGADAQRVSAGRGLGASLDRRKLWKRRAQRGRPDGLSACLLAAGQPLGGAAGEHSTQLRHGGRLTECFCKDYLS